jgi:hypothetical protein
VSVKLARAYEAGRQPAQALAVYEGLLAAQPKASAAAEWCRKARDLAEAAGQPDKAKQWQTRIDELLRKK